MSARATGKPRLLRRALGALSLCLLAAIAVVGIEVARLPDVGTLLRAAPASTVLLDREGSPIGHALGPGDRLAPRVPLRDVHPHLAAATIAAEDARFRSHPGVDPLAVARAARSNLARGRIVSGASTITMQVARLLRPLKRSFYGKFREALLALRLEMALSKDEVLELYLNLSPYGGNLTGVEAAARRYFGRPPRDLSLSEAALLAGLPQSPGRLRPDRHPEAARSRRDRILDRMAALGMVAPEAAREAKAQPVRVAGERLLLAAPHFAAWALRRAAQGARVRTSLDPALQRLCEEAVRARVRALGPAGVRNGAALIAETRSGKIRAFVGSQDFGEPRSGQVNGAAALRSPGSLLKPFIYGLAFERGIAGPETLLDDSPRRFRDGYDPRNFGGGFLGPIAAREALARSLNVPAVDLLERLGVEEAIPRLRRFGLRGIDRPAAHYGLALGLGGVEATLLELVEAYATLGRLGEHRPLSFEEDEPEAPSRRVLSARAAFEVAAALEAAGWPADAREGGVKLPRVALKTGTSFGFRDAWALAATPLYTVGVWLGNFDGEPARVLVGQSAAAPAALELVRRLHPGGEAPWFADPGGAPAPAAPPALGPSPSARGGGVSWIEPPDGAIYARHSQAGGDRMTLLAQGPPAERHSFFVDGVFAGRCLSGESVEWPLRPGTHRVTLVAASGESQTRTVRVEG